MCVCLFVCVSEGVCLYVVGALLFIMGSTSKEEMQSGDTSSVVKRASMNHCTKLKHTKQRVSDESQSANMSTFSDFHRIRGTGGGTMAPSG